MGFGSALSAARLAALFGAAAFVAPAAAEETPKYGGTLTYMIPADAPPSFGLWWYRIVPYRSYVKGWKIGLGTVWLDK